MPGTGSSAPVRRAYSWLELPDGWDTAWRTARAASGTTPCWLAWFGDSYSQGSISTDFMAKSVYALVRANILTRATLYADCYMPGESAYGVTQAGGTYNGTAPFTLDATLSSQNQHGFLNACYRAGAWTNPSITFLTPYACTAIDLFYGNPYAANLTTWTYTIDGGANQTVTNAAATGLYGYRVAITSLANTTHTIRVTAQSADYACHFWGAACYSSTTLGVGFAKFCMGGASLKSLVSNAGQPIDKTLNHQGRTSAGAATGFGYPTQPHLAIISLGLNDCNYGYGVDSYRRGLARLCEGLRRGRSDCALLFVAMSNPEPVHTEVTSGNLTNASTWPYFVGVMKEAASVYRGAFVDFHAKWGPLGVTKGFQGATNPHPIDAGHQDMSDVIAPLIA